MIAPRKLEKQRQPDGEFFRELYDCNDEYLARRDPESNIAKLVLLEVQKFKIPNLVSVIPEGLAYASILEVGCATGELIANFPATASHVHRVGLDVSPRNVAAASSRFPHVTFCAQDFRQSEESFDLIILSDVLEHVPADAELLAIAGQRGSTVLVNLPLEVNWLNRNRAYGVSDPSGHLRAYSLESGLDLMKQAGLRVLRWSRVWSHETTYDVERRALRASLMGRPHAGGAMLGSLKTFVHECARSAPFFGRRLYPSNLFLSARVNK